MYTKEVLLGCERFLEKNNKKGMLLDLDDCLIDVSTPIFKWGFDTYLGGIMELIEGIDESELRQQWKMANKHKHDTVGVRRDKWDVAVEFLASLYPVTVQKIFWQGLPILNEEMYLRKPFWCEGAEEAVTLFRNFGLKIAIVSHGDWDWTRYKMEAVGVDEKVDKVVCADPRKYLRKMLVHWNQGLTGLRINKEEAMGAGDNKKTDIGELYALGVTCLAYIRSPWDVYAEGGLPKGVPPLENIGEWPPYLASLL